MERFFICLLMGMGLTLSGCGGGDDPADGDSGGGGTGGGADAPVLTVTGNPDIPPGSARTLNLSATDANGDNISFTYTVLSTATPFNPPSNMQAMWATGVNSATFSWTPTSADDGEYTVRFTVTDDSTNAYTDSETVTLRVMGPIMRGWDLYDNNCANNCHGFGSNSEKMCRLAADIQDAINNNDGGMGSFSSWSTQNISDTSAYLIYLGETINGQGYCG